MVDFLSDRRVVDLDVLRWIGRRSLEGVGVVDFLLVEGMLTDGGDVAYGFLFDLSTDVVGFGMLAVRLLFGLGRVLLLLLVCEA